MKLKNKIEEIKKVNDNLKEEKRLKIKIFNNKINEVKQFHRKINNFLLKNNNQHLLIKESMNNENNLENYDNIVSKYIINKENLNRIASLKSKIKSKEEKENIKTNIKKIDEEIKLINEKIKKKKKEYKNSYNFSHNQKYIINPILIALDKNNEYLIHVETAENLKENSIKVNQKSKIIQKEIENNEKELQKLKKKFHKNEEKLQNKSALNVEPNIKLDNLSDDDSLGIIDDSIINNIDSPKFLTKVIKNSKLDFQFNERLDFSSIFLGKNNVTSFMNANNKKVNKSNNTIHIKQNTLNLLLNKNKLNKNTNIEKLDLDIKNTENQIKILKEELNKIIEGNENLKNEKVNLELEIKKVNSIIENKKNQIEKSENQLIKDNTISNKKDKDTSTSTIFNSEIFNIVSK